MKPKLAHAMVVAVAVHVALFCVVREFVRLEPDPKRGLIAVQVLADGAEQPFTWAPSEQPPEKRVAEARPTWSPRAASTPAHRAETRPAAAERQSRAAGPAELQPQARAEARTPFRHGAALVLPTVVAVNHPTGGTFAAPELTVTEEIEVGRAPASVPATPAPPPAGRPEAGGDDRWVPPGLLAAGFREPPYPHEARLRGEEGAVLVEVEIRADGSPGRIKVVESSGYPSLDQAVVEALRKGRYTPATKGGRPVPSVRSGHFTFKLEDRDE